jgi:hypothetical protein
LFASLSLHHENGLKSKTWQQVATAKDRAVRFIENVLQDPDRAAEAADESVEDFADRKRIQILHNPSRRGLMAKSNPATKDELESLIDDIEDCLEDVYTPEASREELAEAVGKVLDMIDGDDSDDGSEDSDDTDQD